MQQGSTTYAHRDALYNLALSAPWRNPRESERHVRWTRELRQALRPCATGGVYVNHIGRADQVRAVSGPQAANQRSLTHARRLQSAH
jgi:hypothetical protein